MDNVLEYKGYRAKVEYSAKVGVLFGRIEGIRDLVNFECDNLADVEKEFHRAVDDYLAFCQNLGEAPDKPYKGMFNTVSLGYEQYQQMKAKIELLEILGEAEEDVRFGRIAPMQETFDSLRAKLLTKS